MLVASLSLAVAIAAPLSLPRVELPYAELAQRFLEAHGQSAQTPENVEISAILERDFFSARVGQFEVWIPAVNLTEKETARDFQAICAGLCKAQEHWVNWLGAEVQDSKALLKDFETHRKWIDKWKVAELGTAVKQGKHRAMDLFDASESDQARSDHLAQVMQSGAVVGSSMEVSSPVRLVLMPQRKEFVEFLAFAGWFLPEQQSAFWVPGIENWTEFRLNDFQVIALQYPATAPVEGDYSGYVSMKDRDVTGLEQQAVQLGMNKLFAYQHGDAMPSEVISGLSIQMLIELYGTCQTRNDGDLRGRQTHKREIFIAGGQSQGGQLPQNVAESRWRTEYGKDSYARILKQVQKSGSSSDKRNSHKYNSFLLVGDGESERFIVHAPVFGPGGATSEVPPPSVQGDYMEFLRAYNVAFMHWLKTEAASSKKKSEEAFAKLLVRISNSEADSRLSAIMEECYGMPLSTPEVGTDCLEGLFIKWISKQ